MRRRILGPGGGLEAGALLLCVVAACGEGEPRRSIEAMARTDTLPGGVVVRSYSDIPRGPVARLAADIHLGADAGLVFGDIRGLGVDRDGTLLVLDGQGSELRRFSVEGTELETVASRGEGPQEIQTA